MIGLAMAAPSELCIIPVQDVLGWGQESRMNKPATVVNNWVWKLSSADSLNGQVEHLKNLTHKFQRV
jgi:4-alpha-glucanotransferase